MSPRDPQQRVTGSKVRRAFTGGQTHATERGSGKSTLSVTGVRVALVPRNDDGPRARLAPKADGAPSATPGNIIAMDSDKENIAHQDYQVRQVGSVSVVVTSVFRDPSLALRRTCASAAPGRARADARRYPPSRQNFYRACQPRRHRARAPTWARRRRTGWPPCSVRASAECDEASADYDHPASKLRLNRWITISRGRRPTLS